MNDLSRSIRVGLVAFGLAALPCVVLAGAPDWGKVPTKTVKLFYPGQSSHEWLLSAKHKGARGMKRGDSCLDCHEGEQKDIGKLTVSGEKAESTKVNLDGKPGSIDLAVQVAYDAKNIYWRVQWKTKEAYPGNANPMLRYDGKEWKQYGWPRLDPQVQKDGKPAIFEDAFAIMLDDGKVPKFEKQGCWLTCHQGERDMPGAPSADAVMKQPLLGGVFKATDVRKYLPSTRTDKEASWDKTKSAADIAKIRAEGGFLDLMQWRAQRSNPVGMATDDYVLAYRHEDAGTGPSESNVDPAKHQPKYMFDAKKVGVKAVTAATLRDPKSPQALVKGENAVPFDASAGWKDGDMLPETVESRADAKGSAADNADVHGTWKDGMWTVVWTRPLDTGHPQDDKILKPGGVYTVGFAVHDDNITARGHYVSFPLRLGLGAKKADLQAQKVD